MDWSKAKTVLIVAFIITNIFLAYNLWETKYYGYRYERVNNQRIGEVVAILEERGVEIGAPIPRDVFIQGILTVEYMEISPEQLSRIIFGDRDVQPIVQGNSQKYIYEQKILEVKNRKEMFYTDLALRTETRGSLSERDAVKAGEGFLVGLGLYKPSMIVDRVTSTEKGYSVAFVQEYRSRRIEISMAELEVTPAGVYSAHMLWLNPVKLDNTRKKVVPAIDALIKVVSRKEVMEDKDVSIGDIRLVHYFDWENAREGETFPAWKIDINGRDYYINAFTGQFNK